MRRSRKSVCPSSALCFCFPRVTPTPLTAAPLFCGRLWPVGDYGCVGNYGHVEEYGHVDEYGHVGDYGHVGGYGHVGDYGMWAPMADPTFSCGCRWLTSRMFPHPPNPSFRLHRPTSFATVLSAAPSFLSVLVGGGGVGPLPPHALPPPPLFLFCPQHPTHSADYNSNVLCRIPGHRLALIPSLIIPL